MIDETQADFYFLKDRYKLLFTLDSEASGKKFESKKSESKRAEFYARALEEIKKRSERVTKIVIAGPGFAREDLQNMINQRAKDLLPKIIVEFTYGTGNLGVQELLKKGLIEKITKYSRIAQETNAVERLLEQMNKNKAACGPEKTREAIAAGQAQMILVSDAKIRDYEELLDESDKAGAELMIISSEHDAGQKLLGVGGIAALFF